ncbi:antitermination protein [Salmonella enterica subsp. enterica]|nr:antitermination protein [Salmonella enterica]EBS6311391.1 antitermination protein [Salmonella enterica subsp. enterica serovar Millesi]ECI6608951.1 antitermination protein [Salmonella enterica subsp. enterica]EBW7631709.1 antitermination protein [Salmonella enterica subsp. enterica serovar Millesi]ECA5751870.1 antitermination protein [Salmonella enterica subsp. enterica serovar Millesi]
MDDNLLNYVRIELINALLDRSGKTKGQLEAFAENPLADKNRNPRAPVHVVEFEDGRKVRAENCAVYVLETRSRRRPMPPINDNEFLTAPWRRAVNSLPESEQAWLRYCYGFDLTFKYQTQICEAVWNTYASDLPRGLLRKTQKRLISLVWLAVQEVAAQHLNDTYKTHAGALLASRLGVSRSTWCEVYAEHWQGLKAVVESLDMCALGEVLKRKQCRIFDDDGDELLQNRTK